jgi:hypothetical protein
MLFIFYGQEGLELVPLMKDKHTGNPRKDPSTGNAKIKFSFCYSVKNFKEAYTLMSSFPCKFPVNLTAKQLRQEATCLSYLLVFLLSLSGGILPVFADEWSILNQDDINLGLL